MRCHFTLVTKAGAKHTTMVDYHKGHYKNPMTETEIEGKFRPLAARRAATGAESTGCSRRYGVSTEQANMARDLMQLTTGGLNDEIVVFAPSPPA